MCARSGQPAPSLNISINHVNQEFNQDNQLDYKYCAIRGAKQVVLHIVDARKSYLETTMVTYRLIKTVTAEIERIYLNRHGARRMISSEE